MNYYLEMALYFLGAYILSFIVYAFILNKKKHKKELTERMYIIEKFKLKKSKELDKKLKWILNFVNPLIISVAFIIIINIKSFMLGVMIGFVIMIFLIYAIYEIIGRILKKGEDKNV